jgi:AcrR family transcriptional regulator
VRDLVAAVGTSPSVVYQRVGGKDALYRQVVGYVLAQPADERYAYHADRSDADWKNWVRSVLFPLRRTLAAYPGVAKWVLLHGPVASKNVSLDVSMEHLQSAGFGNRAPLAMSLLVNTALSDIMMADERKSHEDDGPRDHARLITELSESLSHTAQDMIDLISPFTRGGEAAEAAQDQYYQTLINTLLDGLERSLPKA